jgi:hypothetical protein
MLASPLRPTASGSSSWRRRRMTSSSGSGRRTAPRSKPLVARDPSKEQGERRGHDNLTTVPSENMNTTKMQWEIVWRAPRGLAAVALSDFLNLRRDLLLSERQKLAEVGSQKHSFEDKFRGKIMRVCRWMKIIPKDIVIRVGVRISS